MDHLPFPSQAQPMRPFLFRICAAVFYNLSGFDNYPESMAWNYKTLQHRCFFSLDQQRLERVWSFLQNWLYFGMLCDTLALCGIELSATDVYLHYKRSSGKPPQPREL